MLPSSILSSLAAVAADTTFSIGFVAVFSSAACAVSFSVDWTSVLESVVEAGVFSLMERAWVKSSFSDELPSVEAVREELATLGVAESELVACPWFSDFSETTAWWFVTSTLSDCSLVGDVGCTVSIDVFSTLFASSACAKTFPAKKTLAEIAIDATPTFNLRIPKCWRFSAVRDCKR